MKIRMPVVLLSLIALLAMLVPGALAQEDAPAATVQLGGNDDLGAFLVGADGMTLYTFAVDEPGASSCVEQCAENWPPLLVEEGELPTLAEGVPGRLGVITRDDGSRQVTFNGMPLYYWINDEQPGDATGHLVNDVWFAAAPALVSLGGNDDLGAFLVGADGMTLYTFAVDEPGASSCVEQCAENWPPLTVESLDAELDIQPGLAGEFGIIEREDGSFQVTLDDMPLYYWINDVIPGDATGHLVNDVWFAAKLPTVVLGGNDDLGAFLVGADGMTLYTFAVDEPGASSCVEQCAVNWPPLTAAADEALVAGEDVPGELDTITREDGTLQVTYDGAPLYYWINDVIPGDATGHEVNDVWFVAVPEAETASDSATDYDY